MLIDGPAGAIEAIWTERQGRAALLCHPHPLYGGSMHDAVLGAIDAGLAVAGVSTLRFNFRGVGASEGEHDEGRGEVDDVVALAAWLAERSESVMLCGYSFGAMMALAAMPRVNVERALLVAPPIGMTAEPPAVPQQPCLVVVGEEDDWVDADQVVAHFAAPQIRVERIAGADHFFATSGEQLVALASEFGGD